MADVTHQKYTTVPLVEISCRSERACISVCWSQIWSVRGLVLMGLGRGGLVGVGAGVFVFLLRIKSLLQAGAFRFRDDFFSVGAVEIAAFSFGEYSATFAALRGCCRCCCGCCRCSSLAPAVGRSCLCVHVARKHNGQRYFSRPKQQLFRARITRTILPGGTCFIIVSCAHHHTSARCDSGRSRRTLLGDRWRLYHTNPGVVASSA